MPIIFDEELNPKKFRIIKFTDKPTRMQYLEFFGIIKPYYANPDKYLYVPLNLLFGSLKTLESYLYSNLIIYNEVEVDENTKKKKSEAYYIDTIRIYSNVKNKDFYTDPKLRFHSVQDIALLLKCSRQTIYNFIKEGKIESTKMGKKVRISQNAYIQFLLQHAALKDEDLQKFFALKSEQF